MNCKPTHILKPSTCGHYGLLCIGCPVLRCANRWHPVRCGTLDSSHEDDFCTLYYTYAPFPVIQCKTQIYGTTCAASDLVILLQPSLISPLHFSFFSWSFKVSSSSFSQAILQHDSSHTLTVKTVSLLFDALCWNPVQIQTLKVGDRVASAFSTSCGQCYYCKHALTCRCEKGSRFGWIVDGQGIEGSQVAISSIHGIICNANMRYTRAWSCLETYTARTRQYAGFKEKCMQFSLFCWWSLSSVSALLSVHTVSIFCQWYVLSSAPDVGHNILHFTFICSRDRPIVQGMNRWLPA